MAPLLEAALLLGASFGFVLATVLTAVRAPAATAPASAARAGKGPVVHPSARPSAARGDRGHSQGSSDRVTQER